VSNMLPIALCAGYSGGLAGGDVKSEACSRVRGDRVECDGSQEKAEGSNIVWVDYEENRGMLVILAN
jgi:hypothetical protein